MACCNMSPRSQQLQARTSLPSTTTAPCRHRHKRQRTITSILATPVQAQNQKDTTLEALQSALTITAIKTPYLENGRIDLDSYDKLIEQQVLGGVEGVIVGGTTGEGQVCASFSAKSRSLRKLQSNLRGQDYLPFFEGGMHRLEVGELRDTCLAGGRAVDGLGRAYHAHQPHRQHVQAELVSHRKHRQ